VRRRPTAIRYALQTATSPKPAICDGCRSCCCRRSHGPDASGHWRFLTVLAPSERYARKRQQRHKKLTDWGRQMLLRAARWLPDRRIVGVTDSSFAAIELLNDVRRRVCMITRLRLDARLFDPPLVVRACYRDRSRSGQSGQGCRSLEPGDAQSGGDGAPPRGQDGADGQHQHARPGRCDAVKPVWNGSIRAANRVCPSRLRPVIAIFSHSLWPRRPRIHWSITFDSTLTKSA
jgi:hypothetical protein